MKKLRYAILALLFAMSAGCAGTSMRVMKQYEATAGERFNYEIVTKVEVPEKALEIVRARLDSELSNSNLLAVGNNGTRKIEIIFTNYYMRHGATRAAVGIMAGADKIATTVLIKDRSNSVISEFTVDSKNPSAWGSSRGLIEGHVDKIVNYLKMGKS